MRDCSPGFQAPKPCAASAPWMPASCVIADAGGTSLLLCSHLHRQDLLPDETRPDVVVLADCVVIVGRERLVVFLDQPVVRIDLVEALADCITIRAAGPF